MAFPREEFKLVINREWYEKLQDYKKSGLEFLLRKMELIQELNLPTSETKTVQLIILRILTL